MALSGIELIRRCVRVEPSLSSFDESRVFSQDVSGSGALASEDVASPTATLDPHLCVTEPKNQPHKFTRDTHVTTDVLCTVQPFIS